MSHNTRKRGQSRGGRLGSLIRRTGKSRDWCREFLRDFGQFCDVISRSLAVKLWDVDANVAFSLERARMAEEQATRKSPLSKEDLGQILDFKGPEPSISDEPLVTRRRRIPSEDDLKEIFG